MISLGIASLTNIAAKNDTLEGRIGNNFNEEYRNQNDNQKTAGIVLIAGGAVFFILGIIMLASKTNLQRKKEAELEVLKAIQTSPQQAEQKKENSIAKEASLATEELLNKLEMLGKLKDQGLLTEEEFQEQKKKILK